MSSSSYKQQVNVTLLVACHSWYGRKEMFYLTTHSTHFIYGLLFYMHHPTDRPLLHSRGALAGTFLV